MVVESGDSIQVDAVHPLFRGYKDVVTLEEPSVPPSSATAYCLHCSQNFPLDTRSVEHHLRRSRHPPVGDCVYCKGPVYEYWHDKRRLIYHSCVQCSANGLRPEPS